MPADLEKLKAAAREAASKADSAWWGTLIRDEPRDLDEVIADAVVAAIAPHIDAAVTAARVGALEEAVRLALSDGHNAYWTLKGLARAARAKEGGEG